MKLILSMLKATSISEAKFKNCKFLTTVRYPVLLRYAYTMFRTVSELHVSFSLSSKMIKLAHQCYREILGVPFPF